MPPLSLSVIAWRQDRAREGDSEEGPAPGLGATPGGAAAPQTLFKTLPSRPRHKRRVAKRLVASIRPIEGLRSVGPS